MAKRKNNPIQMFGSGPGTGNGDLPLFSGTAQQAQPAGFTPAPADRQLGLFACGFCKDTGQVKVKGRLHLCSCPAGQRLREEAAGSIALPS